VTELARFSRAAQQVAGIAAAVMVAATVSTAHADQDGASQDETIYDKTYDTVVYWGGDFAHNDTEVATGASAGFVTALHGDIGTSDWIATGGLGVSRTDTNVSNSDGFYGSLLVGHQWHLPGVYVSLSGGANLVDNAESPGGGPTDGTEVGAIFQYGFETTALETVHIQSYGAYSTAYDQIYLHAKAGHRIEGLRFGPEFTLFDEDATRPTLRFGGFIGDIPITDAIGMVVAAGLQHELEPGEADGFYATVSFAVPLALR